jgi:hypothetical protein
MTERVERVTKVVEPTDSATTRQTAEQRVGGSTLLARVIWFIAGVLLVLLAFRFVLTLLGANPNNGFADLIAWGLARLVTLNHPEPA